MAKIVNTNIVLTPHPGEMSLLTGLPVDEIQNDRIEIARKHARQWKVTLVLKGALTVIADPEGNVSVVPVATASLAKAGTGDVVAGMNRRIDCPGIETIPCGGRGSLSARSRRFEGRGIDWLQRKCISQ